MELCGCIITRNFLIFEAGIYRLDRDWRCVQFQKLYSIPDDYQAKNWSLDIVIVFKEGLQNLGQGFIHVDT